MDLKCRIKNVDYNFKLVQGVPISEEYSEVLDSASIIISDVERNIDLLPYDDVYLYEGEFNGFTNKLHFYPKVTYDEELITLELPLELLDTLKQNVLIYQNIKIDIMYSVNGNLNSITNVSYKIEVGENNIKLYHEESNQYLPSLNFQLQNEKLITTLYADMYKELFFSSFELSCDDKTFSKEKFYKHFLVLNFKEDRIKANDKTTYKYTIQLCSETKGLETIQLPNISITQPLNINKKVSIYQYMKQYIDMYSPKIKIIDDEASETWKYVNKYSLSEGLIDILNQENESMRYIFDNSYTPDFTLNNPNLRDVLSQLMITKDRIPYVYNNVIYALDITKRRGKFNFDESCINFISTSRDSSNHCDNLKRTYSNALGQDNTCKMVEYLGFRNSDVPLMKIADLRLETRYPIYKINKVLMCYYKKCKILTINEDSSYNSQQKAFLCKQDITKLVKLNSERNLLSKDFNEMENDFKPTTIDEMAQYRMCTVGYDIGSNYITGWGEKYTYIKDDLTWWKYDETYVQNIAKMVDGINKFGTYTYGYITKNLDENQVFIIDGELFPDTQDELYEGFFPNGTLITPFSNNSAALKGFFFIVEYDGFYNGTVIHTKDGATGDITMNDNPSSSLTLLEQDGLAQKEKINRFGNAAITIPARYKSFNEIQPLGSVLDDDIVIYHREYTLNENVINCVYYGMKDYVLKNYFTSVYAKHRPYNLMSYEESVTRAENEKVIFYLSKDNQYYEKENIDVKFTNFDDKFEKLLFSSFNSLKQSDIPSIEYIKQKNRINYAYIKAYGPLYDNDGNITQYSWNNYSSDVNGFVSGYSLCFNLKMYDNVSSGVYISKPEPFKNRADYFTDWIWDPKESTSGSQQSWYMTVDDIETGFAKEMGFYVCHLDQSKLFSDELLDFDLKDFATEKEYALDSYYSTIFKLPLIDLGSEKYIETNTIGNTFEINKDNKEVIDMTFQLEPITDNDDIMFSPWLMKLSDLYGNYNKFDKDLTVDDQVSAKTYFNTLCEFKTLYSLVGEKGDGSGSAYIVPKIDLILDENKITEKLQILEPFEINFLEHYHFTSSLGNLGDVMGLSLKINSILSFDENSITLNVSQQITYIFDSLTVEDITEAKTILEGNKTLTLYRIYNDDFNKVESGTRLYSNVKIIDDVTVSDYYPGWESLSHLTYTDDNGVQYNIDGANVIIYQPEKKYSNVKVYDQNTEQSAIYPKNMFVVLDKMPLKKNLVYDEYPYYYNENDQKQIDFHKLIEASKNLEVNDVFRYDRNHSDNDVISVQVPRVSKEFNSVQYWYLDGVTLDSNYQPDYSKASYKFVFGVNINKREKKPVPATDLINISARIYVSKLSTLNKKVYDNKYNLIGEITDHQDDNTKTYGTGQYYTKK